MKKIVLYNPNPKLNEKKIDVSLALLSVAALPYQNGYDVSVINHSDKNHIEELIRHCKDAVCIGMTVMTGNQIKDGLAVSKILKKEYPKLLVVWGGWHPSTVPEQTIENPYVDIIVRGQGQRTFVELVDCLYKHEDISKVLGISYKENGSIVHNPSRPLEDINNFPSLPYNLVAAEKLITPVTEIASRTITYFTSQGCPMACTFCADPIVYKRRWNALKAERVVAELERMKKAYNINGVVFTDTNFFVNEERVAEICKGMIEKNLSLKWGSVNGRTEHMLRFKEETWQLLKQSNFHSVLIGAESGLQEVLDVIEKKATVRDTIELAEKCKRYGFKIYFSMFIGMPQLGVDMKKRVEKEVKAMVELVDRILSIEKEDMYYLLIYTPYPGSPAFETSKKLGFNPPQSLEEWGDFEHDIANTPWIPKKYVRLIDQFNTLYVPFLTHNIYKKVRNYGRLKYLFYPVCFAAHGAVALRWRTRMFALPLEYYSLKTIKKLLQKFYWS